MNVFSVKIENIDIVPSTLVHIPNFQKHPNLKITSRVLAAGVTYDFSEDLHYIDIDYPFKPTQTWDNIRKIIKEIKILNRNTVIDNLLN